MGALALVAIAVVLMSQGGGKASAPAPQQTTTPPPTDKTGQIIADVSAVLGAGVDFYKKYLES